MASPACASPARPFGHGLDDEALIEPNRLCSYCVRIRDESEVLRSMLTLAEKERSGKELDSIEMENFQDMTEEFLHATYSELESSYLKGCHLCALVWHDLGPTGREKLRAMEFDKILARLFNVHLEVEVQGTLNSELCSLTFKISTEPDRASLFVSLIEKEITPLTSLAPAQFPLSTASSASFRLAKSWLEACASNHHICKENSNASRTALPTRLIDVGVQDGSISPRLIISDELSTRESYLTLSHSWGGQAFFKLTSSILEDLKSGIPVEELSKTFRDAIFITRRLGYRYLWIDSLCIIQDSPDDWRIESALMGSVYGNSTCNVAAISASSHGGCLFRRNPLSIQPCRLLQDSQSSLYAHTGSGGDNAPRSDSDLTPLFHRAWVLQERLIAPRHLLFGEGELQWSCCELRASEFGLRGQERGTPFFHEGTLKVALREALRPFHTWSTADRHKFINVWRDLIREYTSTKLTYESDRMIALAGVVEIVQRRTGLTYIAGMWKELLPEGLLWSRTAEAGIGTRRATAWQPPTWSWASTEGPVNYMLSQPLDSEFETPLSYASRVNDCRVIPMAIQSAPLGEISGAMIKITGFLKAKADSPLPYSYEKEQTVISNDVPYPKGAKVFYFLVLTTKQLHGPEEREKISDRGLLLAANEVGEDTFIRVGMFWNYHDIELKGMFEGLQEETVVIY